MSFTAVIVGRPNVGKSTLFNRLVGRKTALVDDRPGVTRDRREGEASLGNLTFTVTDTAGFEESPEGSLSARMRAQTEEAIRGADLVIFLMDARTGVTPADRHFADIVRRSGKPTVVAANKTEGRVGEAGALEAYELGLGEPIAISAEHGLGTSDLYAAISEKMVAYADEAGSSEDSAKPIKVAVVGRPNAGKSTLINHLLNEERLLTGPEPGITRDAISVSYQWGDHAFELFDTAGLRRRARIEDKLEKLSVGETLRAIRFAEVVVLLLDAERPFEDQDLRIADLVVREGRALVVAVNKSDLVPRRAGALSKLREEVDHWLPQVRGVPAVMISGLRGDGLDRVMQAVLQAHDVWNRRVSTGALNRWLQSVTSEHAPPAVSGRRIKLNYMTQAKARPPSFVLFLSRADALPEDYRRYLVNGLRDAFDLLGTPIRLTLREKENPFDPRKG
jgi:GTP-binding protein